MLQIACVYVQKINKNLTNCIICDKKVLHLFLKYNK